MVVKIRQSAAVSGCEETAKATDLQERVSVYVRKISLSDGSKLIYIHNSNSKMHFSFFWYCDLELDMFKCFHVQYVCVQSKNC